MAWLLFLYTSCLWWQNVNVPHRYTPFIQFTIGAFPSYFHTALHLAFSQIKKGKKKTRKEGTTEEITWMYLANKTAISCLLPTAVDIPFTDSKKITNSVCRSRCIVPVFTSYFSSIFFSHSSWHFVTGLAVWTSLHSPLCVRCVCLYVWCFYVYR